MADNKVESVIVFSQYLTFFFTLLLIYILSNKAKINLDSLFINLCIISIFLESGYILYTFFDNIVFNGETFSRSNIYKGFTANINIAAFSLVAKSPAVFFFTYNSNKLLNKLLGGVLIFMTVSCLWILLSRGAFIAFALIVLLMLTYSFFNKINNNFLNPLILVLPILVSYFIFSNLIVNQEGNLINERVSSIQIDRTDDSIDERLRFYGAALESIKKIHFWE